MNIRFDWRWVAVIVVVAVLANSRVLPWPVPVATLAVAGAYLMWIGWQVWMRSGGKFSRKRETYWRGQRIELAPDRRGPALPRFGNIRSAVPYLLLGGIFLLAALSLALRQFGF